jgi:hypothetical protein
LFSFMHPLLMTFIKVASNHVLLAIGHSLAGLATAVVVQLSSPLALDVSI